MNKQYYKTNRFLLQSESNLIISVYITNAKIFSTKILFHAFATRYLKAMKCVDNTQL